LKLKENPFEELFLELNEGDSACFKISTVSLKAIPIYLDFQDVVDTLVGYIKIHQYLNEEDNKEYLTQYDLELLEQLSIKKYLTQFNDVKHKKGVMIIPMSKGEGEAIKDGKNMLIKYKGSFISGIEFDNTHHHQAFEYRFGTPNQLIEGLEIALSGMKKKEKAKIIIPSQLAFGDEGSSTGIVPPFTSVVYDIEIIDIK